MKLWKKRWFVLSDLCLFYYRGESRPPRSRFVSAELINAALALERSCDLQRSELRLTMYQIGNGCSNLIAEPLLRRNNIHVSFHAALLSLA